MISKEEIYRRREASVIGRIILVMEAFADLDGVMAAPGTGPFLRRHVERIIEMMAGRNGLR